MSIKELLDNLQPEEKELLDYAFEHGLSQFVRIKGGRFVGVNIDHLTYLEPEMKVGVWRAGTDRSQAKGNR